MTAIKMLEKGVLYLKLAVNTRNKKIRPYTRIEINRALKIIDAAVLSNKEAIELKYEMKKLKKKLSAPASAGAN